MFCWLYRIHWSRSIDDGYPLSGRTARHLAKCASCRSEHEAHVALARSLAADAERDAVGAPPFLHGKIVAQLEREEIANERGFPWTKWALGAGLVTAAILIVVQVARQTGIESGSATLQSLEPRLTELTFLANRVNFEQMESRLQQPLTGEAHAVMADARSALEMLADQFLPSNVELRDWLVQAQHRPESQ